MPRTGGVYSPPAGTKGVPNTTIQSVPYNTMIDDLAADANAPRPVTAGGTGATSASGARAALGVEVGTNVQAYDTGLQSIAGLVTSADQTIYTTAADAYATTALTPFARTILDDVNASAALGTLGVSDFMKSLLDDGDATSARATLGANNASNLTAGTVGDARLPSTMAAKTFTATITIGGTSQGIEMGNGSVANTPFIDMHSSGNPNDYDVRLIASGGAAGAGLGSLTVAAANTLFQGAISGPSSASFTGQVIGSSLKTSGDLYVDTNADRRILFRSTMGTTRGMIRHDQAANAMIVSMFDPAGAWYRDLIIGGVSPTMSYNGNLQLGASTYQADGNIYMAWAGDTLYNILSSKITTDGRAYPRRVGGSPINFHWSGQGGQPQWLWGGNDGQEMYVYNPSNFSVNYANSAGYANSSNYANSAGNVPGHGQGWQNVTGSRTYNTAYHNNTGRPMAVTVYAMGGGSVGQNLVVSNDNVNWTIVSSGIYDATSGGSSQSMGNGGFTLVPTNWYYKLLTTAGVSIANWQELR